MQAATCLSTWRVKRPVPCRPGLGGEAELLRPDLDETARSHRRYPPRGKAGPDSVRKYRNPANFNETPDQTTCDATAGPTRPKPQLNYLTGNRG
jgi:hypothetical protein